MSTDSPDHRWMSIRAELRKAVSDSTWDLWLEPLDRPSIDGQQLVVRAPDEKRGWIADRYGRLLQACAAVVLGPGAEVRVLGGADEPAPPGAHPSAGRAAASDPPSPPAATRRQAAERLNPRLTFDQFVIGDSNRMAHAAALAVAEMPGLAYNPLYICGPPGLGKTHLLHSIANYVQAYGAGATVRYTTVDAFTDHFIAAVHHGGDVDAFKEAYRGVDVLLVDDVHFLQNKVKTEDEFFHTFNALHAAGAQIVLTSDQPPRDLDALEDRLRERFEAGLVADVRRPDHGTRLTVLRKRVLQDGLDGVDPAALDLIAERVRQSLRAVEAALVRVIAFGSLTGRPVDVELTEEVLADLYPELGSRGRTVREIQERACEAFAVSLEELLSASRTARLAWPRQVAMYLSRELTDQTLPAIGRAFGNRNHTTVMHACRRTAERIASDPDAHATVDRLTRELRTDAGDRPA